jgi:hypothetical protein
MNAQPHTHQVKITRQWASGKGYWRIDYGDTQVKMVNWVHFINKEKALRRKVAKAIYRHDRGSLQAQAGADCIATLEREANVKLGKFTPYSSDPRLGSFFEQKSEWGSYLYLARSQPEKTNQPS